MKSTLRLRTGATLIEMLLLISILAVLATIAFPHFKEMHTEADDNAHRAQLELIRGAIVRYRIEHGGALPNLIASWDDLTKPTLYRGKTHGPYLARVPRGHKRTTVFDGLKVEPPTPHGFVYDYRGGSGTGMIWATNGSGTKLRKW
jgi:type II secretory pathway pseudopilin PulG